jgi:hypothetical protein
MEGARDPRNGKLRLERISRRQRLQRRIDPIPTEERNLTPTVIPADKHSIGYCSSSSITCSPRRDLKLLARERPLFKGVPFEIHEPWAYRPIALEGAECFAVTAIALQETSGTEITRFHALRHGVRRKPLLQNSI